MDASLTGPNRLSKPMRRTLLILRWLFVGRLVVASAVFLAALVAWADASREQTLVATLALVSAMVVTALGLWWVSIQRRGASDLFLYLQLLYDMVLVTAVVHITHAPTQLSPYAPLYVLAIAGAALLLPVRGGMLLGALGAVMYLADVVFVATRQPQAAIPLGSAALQVVLFLLVAIATAQLGARLRRADTALGEMESELRQLRLDVGEMLAAIDTGLLTVDGSGRLAHINDAARSLTGLTAEAVGQQVLDRLDGVAPGLGAVVRRTAARRQPERRIEIRAQRAEGERILGLRTTLVERGGTPWVTVVLQDITDVKQLEELVRRAERLQAVAELGASLAHEIRNPLASIRSAVEQLAADQLEPGDRAVLRRLVMAESERLTRLLSDFMEFSRVEMRRWSRLDLDALIAGAIELVERHPDRSPGTRIEYHSERGGIEVHGDQDLLHRALFNLVLNAVQYSGLAGLVRVEVAALDESELPVGVDVARPERVRVLDSGPGVRAEDAAHIFDPFYSTRAGGTGLGLALVHRAVEAHRGAILVEAHHGPGACFAMYLPAHDAQEAEVAIPV